MMGWDDSEMKVVQASEKATQLKAEAMARRFSPTRIETLSGCL
jgi:hypothetical protein